MALLKETPGCPRASWSCSLPNRAHAATETTFLKTWFPGLPEYQEPHFLLHRAPDPGHLLSPTQEEMRTGDKGQVSGAEHVQCFRSCKTSWMILSARQAGPRAPSECLSPRKECPSGRTGGVLFHAVPWTDFPNSCPAASLHRYASRFPNNILLSIRGDNATHLLLISLRTIAYNYEKTSR